MDDFRTSTAAKAVAVPEFISDKDAYVPHPELVAISNAILEGKDLDVIADYAWRYQADNAAVLPIYVAARFRVCAKRIRRYLQGVSFAASCTTQQS